MSLSDDVKQGIASHTGVNKLRKAIVLVELIEISHPSFAETIRIAQYNKDIVHNGFTYMGWAFENPSQGGDQAPGSFPTPVLILDNVDQMIAEQIEQSMESDTKPRVVRKQICTLLPNLIQKQSSWFAYNYAYTASRVVLSLTLLENDAAAVPAVPITPVNFPGAFSDL